MSQIETLLELLSLHGGKIVSTASLKDYEIDQARKSDRIFVNDLGLGFVWDPDIRDFPTTEAEIDFFDKWYPMDAIEVPEGIIDRIMERINEFPVPCKLPGVELIGCPLINTDCKTCKCK